MVMSSALMKQAEVLVRCWAPSVESGTLLLVNKNYQMSEQISCKIRTFVGLWEGETVGLAVVGAFEGDFLGFTEGELLGPFEGDLLGSLVVGASLG